MALSVSVASPPQPPERERVSVLGTRIDRVELPALAQWIEAFLASGAPHQVITANLDFIAIARRRPHFARIVDEADLVICDGKPLQWASALQGEWLPARVTGMHLVMETARLSAKRGYRLFLLGAAPGVAVRAARELARLVPRVAIAGTFSPPQGPFSAAEDAHIVSLIRAAQTDALFVALGAPRQDEWIYAHLPELDVPLCAGVGGVFNFLAGETRRAPEWMQRVGFEWAYRLAQEPGRLWRRYLIDDLPLFFELAAEQAAARLGRAAPSPTERAARGEGRSSSWHGSVVASTQRVGGARLALSRELGQVAAAPSAQDIAGSSALCAPRIRKRSCR